MLIINNLEDQIMSLVYLKAPDYLLNTSVYKNIFFLVMHPFSGSQPITILLIKLFRYSSWFNILVFLTIVVCLFFSYRFFRKFKHSFLYSLVFVFSSYFWLHLGTHIDLSQLWLYPMFFILLLGPRHTVIKFSLFLIFAILISNYIGFFLLVYFSLYIAIDLILKFLSSHKFDFLKLKFFILTLLLVGGGSFFILKNYVSSSAEIQVEVPFRNYEDFFTFSTRPWYFVIPSPKHPVYGEFASNTLDKISSTGYFLADDYFVGEHGASFFGYFLLLTFLVVSGYIAFKGSKEQKAELLRYWLISIGLFLLMLPPYFTIAGFKIYTPGWLMYKFFPMFRTTVRMSVLILMNILLVLAPFFDDLSKKYPKKQLLIFSFVALLTGVTLFETFIPVKIQYLDTPPIVYSYIGETYSGTNFVVYPYSRNQEALFWVDAHKSYLLNPRMYRSGDFDSETFTKALNTSEGLEKLPSIFADYLVVFKDIPSEDLLFFLTSDMLVLAKEFDDAYIFKVVNE